MHSIQCLQTCWYSTNPFPACYWGNHSLTYQRQNYYWSPLSRISAHYFYSISIVILSKKQGKKENKGKFCALNSSRSGERCVWWPHQPYHSMSVLHSFADKDLRRIWQSSQVCERQHSVGNILAIYTICRMQFPFLKSEILWSACAKSISQISCVLSCSIWDRTPLQCSSVDIYLFGSLICMASMIQLSTIPLKMPLSLNKCTVIIDILHMLPSLLYSK